MSNKYHIKKDGTVGICSANISCPLTDSFHFASEELAQQYTDRVNELQGTEFYKYAYLHRGSIERVLPYRKLKGVANAKMIPEYQVEFLETADLRVIKDDSLQELQDLRESTTANYTSKEEIMHQMDALYEEFLDTIEVDLSSYYEQNKAYKPEPVEFTVFKAAQNCGKVEVKLDTDLNGDIVIYSSFMDLQKNPLVVSAIYDSVEYWQFSQAAAQYKEKVNISKEQAKQDFIKESQTNNFRYRTDGSFDEKKALIKKNKNLENFSEDTLRLRELAKEEFDRRLKISQTLGQAVISKTNISPRVKYNSKGEICNLADEDGRRIVAVDETLSEDTVLGEMQNMIYFDDYSNLKGGYIVENPDGTREKIYKILENDKDSFASKNRNQTKLYVLEDIPNSTEGEFVNIISNYNIPK